MSILKRLASDDRGSVNVMFAVGLLPLLLAVGSAVDYDRATGIQARLQSAADSTALAMAKQAGQLTDADLQAKGVDYFEGAFSSQWTDAGPNRTARQFLRNSLTVTKTGKTVNVDVKGLYPTTFMKLAGLNDVALAASGQAAWGTRKIEVALVLDNTGSMAGAKITELKKAAKTLVSTLETASKEPDQIKIALVPFNTQVHMDAAAYRNDSWLDFASYGVNKATWTGCVTDRNSGYDTNDVPMAKYPAVQSCTFGNQLALMSPLSSNFGAMRTSIDSMSATGNTNIAIGLAWGLASLSPGAPFTGGAAFGTPDVDKFMIMLTDGDNTQNRFGDSVYQMDQRTKLACDEVKKSANKIALYTIRVMNGNAALLKSCASDTSKYYDVTSASQLNGVFQQIADEITSIRLTM
jgi:Flp pilus assembly protein TadG